MNETGGGQAAEPAEPTGWENTASTSSTQGEPEASLRRVVARYGPNALTDPVALRAALRHCAAELPAAEVDLLLGVTATGAVDLLRRSAPTVTSPREALAAAVESVTSHTATAEPDARRACLAFAAALEARSGTVDPAGPQGQAVAGTEPVAGSEAPRISWEETTRARPLPAPPRPARSRSRLLATLLAVAALAVVAVLVVVLPGQQDRPVPPDRFAIGEVAARYRALGADLLAGARACTPIAPRPGEQEKIDCTVDGWSMVLTAYDTPIRLHAAREQALEPGPESIRSAEATDGGAAFAVDQIRSGTSTVYWDVENPRPISAAVTTATRPLPELVAFWDSRGASAVNRPEVPGAAIAAPALWQLAAPFVNGEDVDCAPVPADRAFAGAVGQVGCSYPNGVTVDFVLMPDADRFTEHRTPLASGSVAQPGTFTFTGWRLEGVDGVALKAVYVRADNGDAEIYFEVDDLFCFGVMRHPELSVAELDAFWTGI